MLIKLKAILTFFTMLLVFSYSRAAYMDAAFLKKHEALLAQFWAYNQQISLEDFVKLEVVRVTDIGSSQAKVDSATQFYIIFYPNKTGHYPEYFYFIDKNMSESQEILKYRMYSDDYLIPLNMAPEYLLDESTKNKSGQIDVYLYFGQIDPADFYVNRMRTDNGYVIEIKPLGFHGSQNDVIAAYEHARDSKKKFASLRNVVRFESVSNLTGKIIVRDEYTPDQRAEYFTQQELKLIEQRTSQKYINAINAIINKVNAYRGKRILHTQNISPACSTFLKSITSKGSN